MLIKGLALQSFQTTTYPQKGCSSTFRCLCRHFLSWSPRPGVGLTRRQTVPCPGQYSAVRRRRRLFVQHSLCRKTRTALKLPAPHVSTTHDCNGAHSLLDTSTETVSDTPGRPSWTKAAADELCNLNICLSPNTGALRSFTRVLSMLLSRF